MKQKLIAATLAVGTVWAGWQFTRWRQTRTAELKTKGTVVETAVGPIEYARQGEGPVLLVSHGGPGGYDQIETMREFVDAGFSVLVPSRPGYLGTPLSAGQTISAQADAMIALLDALGIEQVVTIGVSAGGPIALELALRYPQRLRGLVMLAAVSLPYQPNAETADSLLGKLFLTDGFLWLLDIGTWLFEQFSLRFPLPSAKMMIQTESNLPLEQINNHLNYMQRNPERIAWYKALIRSTGPMSLRKAGLDNDLAQLANILQLPLAQIPLPTLIIHGRADADVTYDNAQFVAEAVPDAQLVTLPHSGHLIWLSPEWDDAKNQLIQFLNQHQKV
ncbi:alpha/beta fold hydrolase [Candidatus Leptofilum sp.]|uniref:alpha/beta fold hydrolase n=1 Tax=Candidatus Leptofilum sp. TaxID=3241576 RepID=UPI003B5A640B